ncbi:MAG: PAS domain-containing protein [Deltaproteobacteria bacterium]|nr:PAS domain-containing protein [Deltaproteobacteria bacterium]
MSDPARHRVVDLDPQTAAAPAEQFLNKYAEDVLASLGDGLILLDTAGRVVFMSPGAEDLTAVSAKHAGGKPAIQMFAGHHWLAERITAFLHGEGRRVADSGELAAPFGRRATVRLTASPVIDSEGMTVGSMLVLHDVVATRALTDTGERGSRVGELAAVAAGLAHEIKNPLGGIKGAAQLLADTLKADPEGLRFTSLITREVDRVSNLLEQLLELTRPPRLRLGAVNIHRLLQEVLTLERAAAANKLTVRLNFDPSLPDVWADEARIRQVFLNLVKNALEAMERRGTLTITTRMETDFHVRTAGQGRSRQYLSVEVEDSGPGIEPEDHERIFTPFFTTKNKGTGLGLAVSDRLVAQHGGLLRVESEPGRWTRFRVSLPVAMPGESS